jgi:hypothetical protein
MDFKEINSFDRKIETEHFQMTRPVRSRLEVTHAVQAKFNFFLYLGPADWVRINANCGGCQFWRFRATIRQTIRS